MLADAAQQTGAVHGMPGACVLHVVASAGRYGAEAVIAALSREQRALGLRVHVAIISDNVDATTPYATELKERCRAEVTVIEGRGLRDLFLATRIAEIAVQVGACIIHSHGYKADILCSRALLTNVRRISTLHGWTNVKPWSRMALYQSLQVRGLSRFDVVVAVHESVWKQHPGLLHLRCKATVPNGVPEQPEEVAELEDLLWLPRDRPLIVVAGRLSPEKGQLVAVEAMRLLKERGCRAALVCAGEGPDKQVLQSRAGMLGLTDCVFFPGYVAASRLLARAHVVLIPSYREGLPIVLLEAMRDRVAIVASAVGGIPSVLDYGRVGRLVTPGSAHEIAEALHGILSDANVRVDLSQAAREHFSLHYSAKVMAQKYSGIYQSAVNSVAPTAGWLSLPEVSLP